MLCPPVERTFCNLLCVYGLFQPVRVRPSNARFVFFCMFTVAVGAGAPTLRFKRLGLSNETNIRIQKIPPGLPCGIFTLSGNKLFDVCKPVLAGVECDRGAEN